MGRSGVSGLCILGCPKNLGQVEAEGQRWQYSGAVMASERWRSSSLLATRFSMVRGEGLCEVADRTRS